MFIPNLRAVIYERLDEQDVYANYRYGAAKPIMCSVVGIDVGMEKTSVRADSSATRGRAEELAGTAIALFKPKEKIKIGDIVIIAGASLEVIKIHPRIDLFGRVDHLEITFRNGVLPDE